MKNNLMLEMKKALDEGEVVNIKYMGSKSRIAKHIVPIIQKHIDDNNITTYIEPFVGGANVIDKIRCKDKYGSDNCESLIELLKHVQAGYELLDTTYVTRQLFERVRKNPEEYPLWVVGCVGFLASYNGRGFIGGYARRGYEKTKTGSRYRDYYDEAKRNLLNQAKLDLFKDIHFSCKDYRYYRDNGISGAVIYCDPPYQGKQRYSTKFDHNEFWDNMRKLSSDNIVIISEQNAPKDFECIWQQDVSRSLNPNNKTRATEKLFVYKGDK